MTKKIINNEKHIPSPVAERSRSTKRSRVGIKICGMKLNPQEVSVLQPDYLGFIFWEPSKRAFKGTIPALPGNTKKVGVFVDATIGEIQKKIKEYDLQGLQLHGKESPEFCKELKKQVKDVTLSAVEVQSEQKFELIKVFSIHDDFDFKALEPYEGACDYFLFDTKGKLPGGNGYTFDWRVLKNYPSTKPYFLSGGIGLEEAEKIKEFLNSPESNYCHAIDVNSRFELEPGLKDIGKLKEFMKSIK